MRVVRRIIFERLVALVVIGSALLLGPPRMETSDASRPQASVGQCLDTIPDVVAFENHEPPSGPCLGEQGGRAASANPVLTPATAAAALARPWSEAIAFVGTRFRNHVCGRFDACKPWYGTLALVIAGSLLLAVGAPRVATAVAAWAFGLQWMLFCFGNGASEWRDADSMYASIWTGAGVMSLWFTAHAGYVASRWASTSPWYTDTQSTTVALESQARVIDQIVELLKRSDPRRFLMISLRGKWGSGKSTVMHLLADRLRASHALVYFDAWEHQGQPNLELALFTEIARNLDVLVPFGWLRRPLLSLLPYLFLRSLAFDLDLRMLRTRVDHRTGLPPPIWWRRRLKSIVGALPRKKRLIVVIDEIDRCDPLVAQTLFTLIPRFLALGRVVVILPTVQESVDFKVFNPLTVELPDLETHMQAIMTSLPTANLKDVLDDREVWPALGADWDALAASSREQDRQARATMRFAVRRTLLNAYLQQPEPVRRALQFEFGEKFFSTVPVHLPAISPDDVVQVLEQFTTVRAALDQFGLLPAQRATLLRYARAQWREATDGLQPRFALRHLNAALVEFLLEFRNGMAGFANVDGDENERFWVAALAIRFALRRIAIGHA
jgi:KAP-like P-loop domain-containing protein